MKLLMICNNTKITNLYYEALIVEDYKVVLAHDAIEGVDLFKKDTFDLVIIDQSINEISGLDVAFILKRISSNIKIILLASIESEKEELLALEMGVDDYIKAPVGLMIFCLRVQKVLNQNQSIIEKELIVDNEDIAIHLEIRKVYKNGLEIHLTQMEYHLLVFLVRNKGIPVTRDLIAKEVWGLDLNGENMRTIDTHIRRLRNKLKINSIKSVRGVGYEWAA